VTSTTRLSQLPDVPTIAESGFPGYEFVVWFAVVGPADMPAPVAKRLNTEINTLLQEPGLKTRFTNLGADLTGTSIEACTAQVHSELARYGALFDSLGMKPE
jgi:tripartite-type tricarboxylate transporter receptor subunit TctC